MPRNIDEPLPDHGLTPDEVNDLVKQIPDEFRKAKDEPKRTKSARKRRAKIKAAVHRRNKLRTAEQRRRAA